MFAKANVNTLIKTSTIDSSKLDTKEKLVVYKDTTIKINKLMDLVNDHFYVYLEDSLDFTNSDLYIYVPHWDFSNWIGKDKLKKIFNNLPIEVVKEYEIPLNYALLKYSIITPERQSAFLAQIYHESGGLKYWEELASGVAYENRKDLGNINKGDGTKYKGRSPIQLTGRSNYREYGKKLGIDLEKNPNLAKETKVGFLISGLFWNNKGLNIIADKNNIDSFKKITKLINGGYNGLQSRINHWIRIKEILNG